MTHVSCRVNASVLSIVGAAGRPSGIRLPFTSSLAGLPCSPRPCGLRPCRSQVPGSVPAASSPCARVASSLLHPARPPPQRALPLHSPAHSQPPLPVCPPGLCSLSVSCLQIQVHEGRGLLSLLRCTIPDARKEESHREFLKK